jgi:hypothetical protein
VLMELLVTPKQLLEGGGFWRHLRIKSKQGAVLRANLASIPGFENLPFRSVDSVPVAYRFVGTRNNQIYAGWWVETSMNFDLWPTVAAPHGPTSCTESSDFNIHKLSYSLVKILKYGIPG